MKEGGNFMIDKVVCNLLIPFSFEMTNWDRIDDSIVAAFNLLKSWG